QPWSEKRSCCTGFPSSPNGQSSTPTLTVTPHGTCSSATHSLTANGPPTTHSGGTTKLSSQRSKSSMPEPAPPNSRLTTQFSTSFTMPASPTLSCPPPTLTAGGKTPEKQNPHC